MDIETRLLNEFMQVVGFQCPAEFWPALGYEGEARFVGIWWERGGDEASWGDGRDMVVGADWSSYLTLFKYNFPLGHRGRWQTGGSEEEATHWLVIDRETERGWLVPVDEAPEVLRRQWGQGTALAAELGVDVAVDGVDNVSLEELWAEVQSRLPLRVEVDENEIRQRMAMQHVQLQALVEALERRGRAG